jgi:acyl carrier protein
MKENFMAENEIFLIVKKIISDVMNINEEMIKIESRLIEDLGAESLDIITLLIEFEDKFDRKIPEEDVRNLVTVNDVVSYIAQKV